MSSNHRRMYAEIVKAIRYVERHMESLEDAKYKLMRQKRKILSMARNYNNRTGSTSGRMERFAARKLRTGGTRRHRNNNNNNYTP